MHKSIALAAEASRLAALLAPVLESHPSRMLIPVLTRALPSGRLGRDHRPTCSFEGPKLSFTRAVIAPVRPQGATGVVGPCGCLGWRSCRTRPCAAPAGFPIKVAMGALRLPAALTNQTRAQRRHLLTGCAWSSTKHPWGARTTVERKS